MKTKKTKTKKTLYGSILTERKQSDQVKFDFLINENKKFLELMLLSNNLHINTNKALTDLVKVFSEFNTTFVTFGSLFVSDDRDRKEGENISVPIEIKKCLQLLAQISKVTYQEKIK